MPKLNIMKIGESLESQKEARKFSNGPSIVLLIEGRFWWSEESECT